MRLIDADALKKVIEHYQNKRYRNREEDFAIWDAFKRAIIIIDNAPTIETKECPYSCEKCAKKMICELGKEMNRPQGKCRTCRHRDPEDKKCDCGALERAGCPFPVSDDYYCKFYEKGGAE